MGKDFHKRHDGVEGNERMDKQVRFLNRKVSFYSRDRDFTVRMEVLW